MFISYLGCVCFLPGLSCSEEKLYLHRRHCRVSLSKLNQNLPPPLLLGSSPASSSYAPQHCHNHHHHHSRSVDKSLNNSFRVFDIPHEAYRALSMTIHCVSSPYLAYPCPLHTNCTQRKNSIYFVFSCLRA